MSTRPRLAVISTIYYPLSHSDVIVTRWLKPLESDPAFGWPSTGLVQPRTDIVSAYIKEFTDKDIGRETLKNHNVPLFSTIREALTMGGDQLAVDGVLLIGEHGTYPTNEFDQKMYPRRELFDEIVAVFKESGRSVPIFNDKFLSYNAASAIHMVNTSKELGFPLMGGSSIPICGTTKPWPAPQNAELTEAVGIYYGGNEPYGYHSIAFLQSLVARRAGGETGIKNVTSYSGEAFWKANNEGVWPADLVEIAVKESITHEEGKWQTSLTGPKKPAAHHDKWPAAFVFEHYDNFRSIYLNMNGFLQDWTVAARDKNGAIYSGCSDAANNGKENFYAHFAMLNAKIEEFMLTGKSPYPIDHYLLTTLAIDVAVRALYQPGVKIETPDLALPYKL